MTTLTPAEVERLMRRFGSRNFGGIPQYWTEWTVAITEAWPAIYRALTAAPAVVTISPTPEQAEEFKRLWAEQPPGKLNALPRSPMVSTEPSQEGLGRSGEAPESAPKEIPRGYGIDDGKRYNVNRDGTLSPIAPQSATPAESAAMGDVRAERARQQSVEGWNSAHDDEHAGGQLVDAAICYLRDSFIDADGTQRWPWGLEWWKPKDKRRNLVRAGALIVAEIERLDRLAPPTAGEPKHGI